jgi:hypothetical protein
MLVDDREDLIDLRRQCAHRLRLRLDDVAHPFVVVPALLATFGELRDALVALALELIGDTFELLVDLTSPIASSSGLSGIGTPPPSRLARKDDCIAPGLRTPAGWEWARRLDN